ncbi:unnamed protein product [Caenorhabditis brenneri]
MEEEINELPEVEPQPPFVQLADPYQLGNREFVDYVNQLPNQHRNLSPRSLHRYVNLALLAVAREAQHGVDEGVLEDQDQVEVEDIVRGQRRPQAPDDSDIEDEQLEYLEDSEESDEEWRFDGGDEDEEEESDEEDEGINSDDGEDLLRRPPRVDTDEEEEEEEEQE